MFKWVIKQKRFLVVEKGEKIAEPYIEPTLAEIFSLDEIGEVEKSCILIIEKIDL